MERLDVGERLEGEGVQELLGYLPTSYFRDRNYTLTVLYQYMFVEEIPRPETLLDKLCYLLPLTIWKG